MAGKSFSPSRMSTARKLTFEALTDLELAQQGAIEAADEIRQLAASRVSGQALLRIEPVVADPEALSFDKSKNLTSFHLFSKLPMDMRSYIIDHHLPVCRIVKIFCDDFTVTTINPFTEEITEEKVYCAKARLWISPLVAVCKDTYMLLMRRDYMVGFRLRHIPLRFNFEQDTLYFADSAALTSLLGPIEGDEVRVPSRSEDIVSVFDRNGPKTVVLAGRASDYKELYTTMKCFAWLDTLIMEEPARVRGTPLVRVIELEKEIKTALEDIWKYARGLVEFLPLIRFLPRRNVEFMASSFLERPLIT